MTAPEPDPIVADLTPTAFISYSWDDAAHKEWVKQLATRLRGDGINVTLDHWHAAPGDQIPSFMERAVRENDFVIAVCTPRFRERSDGRDGGVGYEGDILTAYVFTEPGKRKFIPVLRSGSWSEAAPTWLIARVKIDLTGDPYHESEYEELLRTLHGAREKPPPVGPRPNFVDHKGSRANPALASGTTLGESSTPPHQSSVTPPPPVTGQIVSVRSSGQPVRPLRQGRSAAPRSTPNPFTARSNITDAGAFFDRVREKSYLRDHLEKGNSCQIIGPRRIGKTSLLQQVEQLMPKWRRNATVCFVNLDDPRCTTLRGWLAHVAKLWGWNSAPQTDDEFARQLELVRNAGRYSVLGLDEFEKMAIRRDQFSHDFFCGLRACCQSQLLSVVTTSQRLLSELTNPEDPRLSPFYNIVVPVVLDLFSREAAEDFVKVNRPGVDPPFAHAEQNAILGFAQNHPLALQVACYHVLAAREHGDSFDEATKRARAEMETLLPSWPKWRPYSHSL